LWEYHGAPKLDTELRTYQGVRPRNVTVERREIDMILDAAEPFMRLWILLCSDLAIRSGTAARIAPHQYDQTAQVLRFITKRQACLTLPVTAEVQALIETCDLNSSVSFVRQLWIREPRHVGYQPAPTGKTADRLRVRFRELCLSVGITRRLIPHDLRRTSAVALYKATGDIRDAQSLLGHKHLQSTLWYLDHDMNPVQRELLEQIKRPFIVARKEQTA
jgi:integrase